MCFLLEAVFDGFAVERFIVPIDIHQRFDITFNRASVQITDTLFFIGIHHDDPLNNTALFLKLFRSFKRQAASR